MPLYLPDTPLHPGVRPGVYFHSPAGANGTATATTQASVLYAQPISLPGSRIDRLAIEVTTGASGLCRVGIASNASGLPGSLILDAGALDTTTVGIVEAAVDFTFPNDWVWMVCLFNAAPVVRRLSQVADGAAILGSTTPSAGASSGLFAPLAYGPLPATMPTSGYTLGFPPTVYVRKT